MLLGMKPILCLERLAMASGKDSYHLSHDALARPVLVKKSPRAKRMTLRVSPSRREVTLTVPRRAGEKRVGAFLEQHIDWLNQQIDELPRPVPFENGATIPYEGRAHRLSFLGPRTRQQQGLAVITQKLPDETARDEQALAELQVLGTVDHAPRRLLDWLKKQARRRLVERVEFHADRLGLSYRRIGVRDQSSRWGSCSSNRTLSFSWRLILAPRHVLDYVAAHEVAHLREMNHSPQFWALVEKTMPEHRAARNWLRQHGHELYRYGARD